LSHARHLLFIGGDEQLQRMATAEVALAAAELSGTATPASLIKELATPAGGPRQSPSGEARRLLTSDDVRAVTGFSGEFSGAPLGSPGDATDTWHLRATDRSERYDVAVRIWRRDDAALQQKYDEILKALPGATQQDEMGDHSFRAVQDEILGLGFLSRSAETIVLLTCGKGQCTSEEVLLNIAKRVEKNLLRLPGLLDMTRLKEAEPATPPTEPAQP
jgi:hypothetical protein